MAILIIYLFNPRQKRNDLLDNKETKLLMYIFGIVLIFTSNWVQFISDSTIISILHKHKFI
jgi:hypothetical protein